MLKIDIERQPDDETCGPTSLHAIYSYYQDSISLNQVITEVERIASGGTIAAKLGKHALQRGYRANLYIYNLDFFDPTWFYPHKLTNQMLIQKLTEQAKHKKQPRFQETTTAYIDFIAEGGNIHFENLTVSLLKKFFHEKTPILTGLSATYLYQSAREKALPGGQLVYDDVQGEPCGHFVVLYGYDQKKRHVVVADPHLKNPISNDHYYRVSISRLINAVLLGLLTYDANLLVIKPRS